VVVLEHLAGGRQQQVHSHTVKVMHTHRAHAQHTNTYKQPQVELRTIVCEKPSH
jgi:hypothetical protein